MSHEGARDRVVSEARAGYAFTVPDSAIPLQRGQKPIAAPELQVPCAQCVPRPIPRLGSS